MVNLTDADYILIGRSETERLLPIYTNNGHRFYYDPTKLNRISDKKWNEIGRLIVKVGNLTNFSKKVCQQRVGSWEIMGKIIYDYCKKQKFKCVTLLQK